ncbi:hypothetical protein ABIC15_000164 [Exiguobacterium sp. PvP048]
MKEILFQETKFTKCGLRFFVRTGTGFFSVEKLRILENGSFLSNRQWIGNTGHDVYIVHY